jgi:hypothetical protein
MIWIIWLYSASLYSLLCCLCFSGNCLLSFTSPALFRIVQFS